MMHEDGEEHAAAAAFQNVRAVSIDIHCARAANDTAQPGPREAAKAPYGGHLVDTKKHKARPFDRERAPIYLKMLVNLERAKGFEPSTPTLARLCSTPELHPRPKACERQRQTSRSSR
jgi:hypothetical protein